MSEPQTIVRGSAIAHLQRVIYDFDPTRGWNVMSEYEGASQTLLNSLAQQYAAAGIACRLILEKDKGSIEAHDATQQYTLDTWQIIGNDESRDGLSHPTVLGICNNDQVAGIRYGINNLDTSQPVSGAIAAILANAIFNGISADDKTILSDFIGLQLRGSTDYRKAQFVLRHSTNCPNKWPANNQPSWPANIASSNYEAIYTMASMIAETTNSSFWILSLPPEMQYFCQHLTAPTPQANYQWGWLKNGSTQTTAANNRIEIATEYSLEQWSTRYYPNVI